MKYKTNSVSFQKKTKTNKRRNKVSTKSKIQTSKNGSNLDTKLEEKLREQVQLFLQQSESHLNENQIENFGINGTNIEQRTPIKRRKNQWKNTGNSLDDDDDNNCEFEKQEFDSPNMFNNSYICETKNQNQKKYSEKMIKKEKLKQNNLDKIKKQKEKRKLINDLALNENKKERKNSIVRDNEGTKFSSDSNDTMRKNSKEGSSSKIKKDKKINVQKCDEFSDRQTDKGNHLQSTGKYVLSHTGNDFQETPVKLSKKKRKKLLRKLNMTETNVNNNYKTSNIAENNNSSHKFKKKNTMKKLKAETNGNLEQSEDVTKGKRKKNPLKGGNDEEVEDVNKNHNMSKTSKKLKALEKLEQKKLKANRLKDKILKKKRNNRESNNINNNMESDEKTNASNVNKKSKKKNKRKLNESYDDGENEKAKTTENQADTFQYANILASAGNSGGGHKKEKYFNSKHSTLREKLMNRLKAARFRYLNEQMYTSKSEESKEFFKEDPESFAAYHEGFQKQVNQWPINPVDLIIKTLKQREERKLIIADLGCGEAKISQALSQHKVHSFDLVAINDRVTPCDMTHTPLRNTSADVVVFCLSLMGTDLNACIKEANRILKVGGELKIAEVESRFHDVNTFISDIEKFGFERTDIDLSYNIFYFLNFKKKSNLSTTRKRKLPDISLKACLYKKR